MYSIRTGCQCLRGQSHPTDELQRATALMGYSGDSRRTFLNIRRATWAPEARDFIWDLAAGALPTGRGVGLPSSNCLVCEGVWDDLLHVMQCPCLHMLRLWTADVMPMIGLPRTQFHLLLAQGVPQGDGADGAIRSAVATAMRRNRAYMLVNHRAMPGHERHIVNTARRLLRDHIAMDRLFAFGAIERWQRHNKHYESRPASRADFIDPPGFKGQRHTHSRRRGLGGSVASTWQPYVQPRTVGGAQRGGTCGDSAPNGFCELRPPVRGQRKRGPQRAEGRKLKRM
jgi:hypothetical protein